MDKNKKKKLQNIYLADYNFFIAPDLWQAHCQILSMSILKEFIKLNVNIETTLKMI